MSKLFYRWTIVVSVVLFMFTSCERSADLLPDVSDALVIKQAEDYFKTLTGEEYSQDKGATAKKSSAYGIERQPVWMAAEVQTLTNKAKAVLVPFNFNGTYSVELGEDKVDLAPYSYLLVYTRPTGERIMNIVELIPSKDYRLKNNKKVSERDFSGTAVVKQWDGSIVNVLRYKDGKRTKKQPNGGRASSARCSQFITYYACDYCNYYCHGCTAIGGECMQDDSGYGGGGGGTDYYNPGDGNSGDPNLPMPKVEPTVVDIMIDPNLDDCFKGVIGAVTPDRMKSKLTNIVNSAFGSNNGSRNLTFKAGAADGGIAGFDKDKNTIFLDATKRGTATNEYVAAVLFHEMAHVVISEFNQSFLSPTTYDQHVQIFETMVNDIKNGLLETYPNLDKVDVLSLALSGIDDYVRDDKGNIRPEVDRASRYKYNLSMADASFNANKYLSGVKGTPCNR